MSVRTYRIDDIQFLIHMSRLFFTPYLARGCFSLLLPVRVTLCAWFFLTVPIARSAMYLLYSDACSSYAKTL